MTEVTAFILRRGGSPSDNDLGQHPSPSRGGRGLDSGEWGQQVPPSLRIITEYIGSWYVYDSVPENREVRIRSPKNNTEPLEKLQVRWWSECLETPHHDNDRTGVYSVIVERVSSICAPIRSLLLHFPMAQNSTTPPNFSTNSSIWHGISISRSPIHQAKRPRATRGRQLFDIFSPNDLLITSSSHNAPTLSISPRAGHGSRSQARQWQLKRPLDFDEVRDSNSRSGLRLFPSLSSAPSARSTLGTRWDNKPRYASVLPGGWGLA